MLLRIVKLNCASALLQFTFVSLICLLGILTGCDHTSASTTQPVAPHRFVLDSATSYSNTQSAPPSLKDPAKLAAWGYNGQVIDSVLGLEPFDTLDPTLVSKNSAERTWMKARSLNIDAEIAAAHKAGISCYSPIDLIAFPTEVVNRYKSEICDEKGCIDALKPRTQQLLRVMFNEIFDRFPDLDGLVVRTGEIYLTDYPYLSADAKGNGSRIMGSSAILHGTLTHIELIRLLREQVCVARNKMVFYRTWDFGYFHTNPEFYLEVTNAIVPHPNLIFSIKHQQGDFHQLTPFNPTLMIGKHRQIIEVQAQREAYGKGAHPYYIGKGVIDGWEEYAWMMKSGEPKGLRDVINNPLCAGVWSWSRGGGWEGPYITDEFWPLLNAYVIAKFAEDPSRTEEQIFDQYAQNLGFSPQDIQLFRQLNLLSTQAVLRGQLTTLGARIDLWWARDHFLAAPDLSDFVKKGLVDKALAEKAESVQMWSQIESLSRQIHYPNQHLQGLIVTSCTYGRIKYAIIEQAWTILFLGRAGDTSGHYDREKLAIAIAAYDGLWKDWRDLKANNPTCATLYKDQGFKGRPGIGAAVDHYRGLIAASQPTTR